MPRGVRAGALFYLFGADTRRLEAGAKRSATALRAQQRALRNLQRTVRETSQRFRSFQRRIVSVRGAVGLLVGSGALGLLIRRQAQFGAQLVQVSERLGFSIERVQLLQRAFESEGLAIQQINIGLQRFTRRLADAASGNAQLQGTFRSLGVNIRDAQGRLRSSHDVLLDVAEGLKNTDSQAQRVLRSFQLFDSEGVAFVNVLQRGRKALLAQQEAFRRLGLVLEEEARALDDLDKSFKDLANALQAAAARGVAAASDEFQRLNQLLIANGPRAIEKMVGAVAHLTENIEALKDTALVFSVFLALRWARSVTLAVQAVKGLTLAAAAARLGLGALAGPAGLLLAAAAAFAFYKLRAEEATDRTKEFAQETLNAAAAAARLAKSPVGKVLAFEAAVRTIESQIRLYELLIEAQEKLQKRISGYGKGRAQKEIERLRQAVINLRKEAEFAKERLRELLLGGKEKGGAGAQTRRPAPIARGFGAQIEADLARRERAQQQAVALSRLEGEARAALAAEYKLTNKLADEQSRIERQLTRALKERRAALGAGPGAGQAFDAAHRKVEQLRAERAALAGTVKGQEKFIQQERELAVTRHKHAEGTKKLNEALAQQKAVREAAIEGARSHLVFEIGAQQELVRRAELAQEGIRRVAEGTELQQGALQALEETEQRRAELLRERFEAQLQGDAAAVASIKRQIEALENLSGRQQRYAADLQKTLDAEKLLAELRKNSAKTAGQEFRARTEELAVENERFKLASKLRGLTGEDRAAQQLKNELEEHEMALRRFQGETKNIELLDQGQIDALDQQIKKLKELRENDATLRKRFGEDIDARAEQNASARLIVLEKQRLELAKQISGTLVSGLEQAIFNAENLGDVMRHTAAALAKIAIQQLALKPLEGFLGGLFGGAAPGKAAGGPVEAGRLYTVGETGRELFRPRVGGEIIPNYKLRAREAGGGNVFHFSFNIQSTDGPGVRAAIEEVRPLLIGDAVRAARGAMRVDISRNSPVRAAARN